MREKKIFAIKALSVFLSVILAVSICFPSTLLPEEYDNSVSYVFAAAKKPTYTISPNSKPYYKKWLKYSTYNKNSKHWYLFRSYMERFAKTGGGTLIVKKGTYNLPISVYVPSNVTFKFQDGVVLKKTTKTGTKKLHNNGSMFQLISPTKCKKENAVYNYNGTKNVKFLGTGKVTFKMRKAHNACTIIMAQNQNVTFKNITFTNGGGHYFELDASKKVNIESCTFQKITNDSKTCEAINLDTPDKATGGFSFPWSKKDKKPNIDVTIKNCTFTDMNRAIGTHKYSQDKGKDMMHTNIKIIGNTFKNVRGFEGAIMAFNWKNVTIDGNTFIGTGTDEKTYAMSLLSVDSANITNNKIENYENTIIIRRGYNASGYNDPPMWNMTDAQLELLFTNKYKYGTVVCGEAQATTFPYWHSGKMEYYALDVYDAPEPEEEPTSEPEEEPTSESKEEPTSEQESIEVTFIS